VTALDAGGVREVARAASGLALGTRLN
jgi:hypothetical protein